MSALPESFFWAVGIMVIFNIGTIATVIAAIVKLTWFLSELNARVKHLETHHSKDIDAAFMKIREIEKSVNH